MSLLFKWSQWRIAIFVFSQDIFFHMDNNRDGILSLVELRQAVDATGSF